MCLKVRADERVVVKQPPFSSGVRSTTKCTVDCWCVCAHVQCDQWLTFLLQSVYLPAQHGSDTSKYGHTDDVQCNEETHHTCEDLH